MSSVGLWDLCDDHALIRRGIRDTAGEQRSERCPRCIMRTARDRLLPSEFDAKAALSARSGN
jgi:hypothetical protein